MSTQSLNVSTTRAVCVELEGRVQGLGIRPLAARLANEHALAGSVANSAKGIALILEGEHKRIEAFLTELFGLLPIGAAVLRFEVHEIDVHRLPSFEIVASVGEGASAAAVPLDRVVCRQCLADTHDPNDRRYGYAFTSCTHCGPRYTILRSMPYDRHTTSMREFSACEDCRREYQFLGDRRAHAQTIACRVCGPRVRLCDEHGVKHEAEAALTIAAELLAAGKIVAVKGLGGYQLLTDATSSAAVRRLRARKRRLSKPFAVLVADLAAAEQLAVLNETERRLLADAAGPIVVVRRRAGVELAVDVAPQLQTVGLMLPTTPLHSRLCDAVRRPLVCTSGNSEGDPLVYDDRRALDELRGVADAWLAHDRPVVRPIDDSLVCVVADRPCHLRLARGYAPLVLPPLPGVPAEPLIAVGGELNVAPALWNGSQAVLGPYVGDLQSTSTCERWQAELQSLATLYGVRTCDAYFIHDQHPEYFSTLWSRRHDKRLGVQHHHAHIAAVLLEHQVFDREVLGLAWDGTGYGDDGTIWGGECLQSDCRRYRRVARLRPFPLIGGETAVREPWRVAAAMLCESLGPEAALRFPWHNADDVPIRHLIECISRPRLFPSTSSMGRLFDAVAALTLGIA
ncbi:MAG: carbamoyltransferase HypF, partial [Planctomycetaceae bacterium]|nr:carbamoyltransferase HypF [Planctomycetaceae bacterium]